MAKIKTKLSMKEQSFNDMLKQLKANVVVEPLRVNTVEERRYFLIVCEGLRTEPNYFRYFGHFLPPNMVDTLEIDPAGDNTINVVQKTIELRDKRINDGILPPFDEAWAVYDKDDFSPQRYHTAQQLAIQHSIESGHSNEAFELWYILHFEYLDTAVKRDHYFTLLSDIMGFAYGKNDMNAVRHIFEKGNIHNAIRRAKKLEKMHNDPHHSSACPYTRVYQLVERLLNYVDPKEMGLVPIPPDCL